MKLSGYTTIRNAVEMDYPFEESIESFLGSCDEVVVVDSSDKNDGTKDSLRALKNKHGSNLKILEAEVDWNAPNHGVFDGVLKQLARENCTGEILCQFDLDEVLQPNQRSKFENLLEQANYLNGEIPVLCLPVVEYWGSYDKTRIDVNSWKWRLSKNDNDITHGIPITHRNYVNGVLYSKPGSDGCDLISKKTGYPIPSMNFINEQTERARMEALKGNQEALTQYGLWFNHITNNLPTVYHYSWFSIKSKIEKYKLFWDKFWPSLYNQKQEINNVFFNNVPWEQVSNEMIEQKAKELKEGTGGHVFHSPWNGVNTPSIKLEVQPPEIMKDWCEKHSL